MLVVVGRAGGGTGHEGRAEDAVAQSVAAPDLLDDLALGRPVPGTLAIASCSRGSNGVPGSASIGGHALALEEQAQLAVDGGDALEPGVVGDRRRAGLDGPVEVVGEARTLRMRSSAARPRSRSRSSLVRRLKLRNSARSRWRAARYSSAGLLVAASRSAVERLDVGEQRGRRDVDLVGALLGARAVVRPPVGVQA